MEGGGGEGGECVGRHIPAGDGLGGLCPFERLVGQLPSPFDDFAKVSAWGV